MHENKERIKHTVPSKAQFKNHKEHYNERDNMNGSHPHFLTFLQQATS